MDEGEYRATRAVEQVFDRARRLSVHPLGGDVTVDAGDGRWRLHPVWIGEGFPQDVRRALERSAQAGEDATRVLVARRMSTGSRALLADLDVNWLDLDGNADIQIDGLYVATGKAERMRKPPPAFKWSRSSAAVAEVVLDQIVGDGLPAVAEPREISRVQTISEISGWSHAQVGKVLQQFDVEGYTEKVGTQRGIGAARFLKTPGRLLSDWAGWYRKHYLDHVSLTGESRDPLSYVELAREAFGGDRVVVSGWPALEGYAPYMGAVPSTLLYVDATDLEEVQHRLVRFDLRIVQSGARLTVMLAEPQTIKSARTGPPPFRSVSPIRLYGDLLRVGVRGEDAANHLREVSIGF